MLKKNNLIKVLSLTSILFILFLVFNFTTIYAEKLSDVTDVIKEILQDGKNKITEVKHLDNDKYVIVGYRENSGDKKETAESWIKVINKGKIITKKEFVLEQDIIRKVLRCVVLDKKGNYLLGGYQQKKDEGKKAWLLLLDKNGEEISYNNTYDDNCYASEFKAIASQKEGGYILVGWKCDNKVEYDKKNFDPWVISVNSEFIKHEKDEVNFIKKDTKDFATDIVRETPANSQEVNYVIAIAIEDQKEKSKTIRLIKINESLEEIVEENREEKKMEIDLKLGDGGIYYISEDNEDGLIIAGYDKDPKNNNNNKSLWVREFSDIGWDKELLRRSDNNVNRFVFGIEKNNEDYFTLISYPNNIKIPLQLVKEGINEKKPTLDEIKGKDDIIEGKTDEEQSNGEEITTAVEEIIEEDTKEGEEGTTEPGETTLLDKIKEIINNINISYLLILLGLILIFSILYFAIKSQKKGKLNKIEYTNFSLSRIEEIESLLKRIQIELKKELYEAEQLNNFSYKQRLKEIKIKFISVAKKYKNKDVDLLVIKKQLEDLLEEINITIR